MLTFFRSVFAPPRHFILLFAGLWIGLALAEKRSDRHGISKETLNNLVYYSLLGYILGGRILFALANSSAFSNHLLSLFSLNTDLFDPFGAGATAVLTGLVYGRRRKLALGSTLDALTPLFAVLAIGLALSHLAVGTAFGSPTAVPWGIEMWNATRHPTQLYELLAALLIFLLIWFRRDRIPAGEHFLLFLSLSAGARLFLEAFRGDSTLILGGLRLAQVVAWLILAGTLVAFERLRQSREPDPAAAPGQQNFID